MKKKYVAVGTGIKHVNGKCLCGRKYSSDRSCRQFI